MKFCLSIFSLLLFFTGCGSTKHIEIELTPGQYVVLDSVYAAEITNQCSRDRFEIESSWNPSVSEINNLESNLGGIYEVSSDFGFKLDDVNLYCRQYVGIVLDGEKLIYINALPIYYKTNKKESFCNWTDEPCIVCDGGESYWGVVYNPATKEFSRLSFNGYA